MVCIQSEAITLINQKQESGWIRNSAVTEDCIQMQQPASQLFQKLWLNDAAINILQWKLFRNLLRTWNFNNF